MRLVHFLFNYPLLLLIIVMDSALTAGDKSVSKQWNLNPQRSEQSGTEDATGPLALSCKTLR